MLRHFMLLLTLTLAVSPALATPVSADTPPALVFSDEPIQLASANPDALAGATEGSTWGSIKALYDEPGDPSEEGEFGTPQLVGGVGRYDSFPSAWRFPFYGSRRIEVGYGGTVCGGGFDPYHTGGDHHAIDWNTPGPGDNNAPVPAPASGWVIQSGPNGRYGNTVTVEAGNGYRYLIAHMNDYVRFCGWIERGQWLGTVGSTGWSTGPHIHFVVYRYGSSVPQNGISGQWNLQVCSYYPSGQ